MTQNTPEPAHTTDWVRSPWPVARLRQAIGDPGSIVGNCRGPLWRVGHPSHAPKQETFPQWATRAVLFVLDEFDRQLAQQVEAANAHIDVITTGGTTVDRAVQLREEMAARWIKLPVVGEVPAEQPVIFAGIADRLPPGVEIEAPALADEFPSELPR